MGQANSGSEQLLTPSKITAWLDCAHYLTLKHEVESGARAKPEQAFGSFARLLQDKGLQHEAAVLDRYVAKGRHVLSVEEKLKGERFAAWASRSLPALDGDADLVFQMPFVHDGVRGVADFLERHVDDETGAVRWEPVDAKLARLEAKPGHVLQLCFYAEAIAALTGEVPQDLKVSLGSGVTETVSYEEIRPYWSRLRVRLREVLDRMPVEGEESATRGEPCTHCMFCEFQDTCETAWREEDSLIFVAGITKKERAVLEPAAIDTLAKLATVTEPVEGLRPERLARLRVQADLQVQARAQPDAKPPFVLVEAGDDPVWGHGFDQLPQPDPGDIFLDFEGHPFWRADRGLFFLFGFIAADDHGEWQFHQLWALDEADERERVAELVAYIEDRRARHPGMHVYHYNHTERSALEALASEHAVAESALAALVDRGVFVDLLLVARHAVQVGTEGYGLKHLERLTDYERNHDIDKGAGAVVAFDQYLQDRDQAHLDAIAVYNEDDVRATRALRDWLVDQRPANRAWLEPMVEPEDDPQDVDELLEALAAFNEGSVERLLADLLGYWRRERSAYAAPLMGTLAAETDHHLEHGDAIGELQELELIEVRTKSGKISEVSTLRLTFPEQKLTADYASGRVDNVHYLADEGRFCSAEVRSIDVEAGTIDLAWNKKAKELATIPGVLVPDTWRHPSSKRTALTLLAHQAVDPATHGDPNPVTMALLRGDSPAFRAGGGPPDGRFGDDPAQLATWATELEDGVLAVQGPPGTGKTYRGAHMAKALVAQGKRVGIMAMSHAAIDNFLTEIVDVFSQDPGVPLRAARKLDEPEDGGLPGVTYSVKNLASDDYNVVCGTAWQFAGKDLLAKPVDVLLIDEAGQLALIDAVVGSMSAHSVVLLGDPQQLPQVAVASQPGGSGASAIGHLLLDDDETMPDTRGVFIEETRRMHPDVCRFISERIYQGRLHSHEDCANQGTDLGTGLRWLQVDHTGCATESIEEAEAVAGQIKDLLGHNWTDKDSVSRAIGVDDIMVVAPYNDQVHLIRAHLDADPATRGVPVGTVDKFQGRQAPVVLFTMTSSSSDDMPRGIEFLFSKNRLNVAVSRAQCLAYLVCTEQLLHSRAKTVEDMKLIATLCAFVEYAEP